MEYLDDFRGFLRLLDSEGLLSDVVIVGSWCEFLYQECELFEKGSFRANIRTHDVDVLIKNQRVPRTPAALPKAAVANGYAIARDRGSGISTFVNENDFEVEFLIAKRGAGLETGLKTNLGVVAQSLWHLDVLSGNIKEVSWEEVNLQIPVPEAYVLHKMIINHERSEKARKDALSIEGIVPFLDKGSFLKIYSSLSKKEKRYVNAYLMENNLGEALGFPEVASQHSVVDATACDVKKQIEASQNGGGTFDRERVGQYGPRIR